MTIPIAFVTEPEVTSDVRGKLIFNNKKKMKKTIIFLFLFFIAISNTIEKDQYNKYKWAPISSLKKPFITFMNDFDHPTWVSTNSITKRMTTARIYIPNNVDFSIICGVCIRDTRKANSLLSQSNLYLQPHIFNNTQKRISFTFRAGINKCLVIKEFTKNPISNIINNKGEVVCKYNEKYDAKLRYDIVEPKRIFKGTSDDDRDDIFPCPKSFNYKTLLNYNNNNDYNVINCTFYNFLDPNVYIHNFQYKNFLDGDGTSKRNCSFQIFISFVTIIIGCAISILIYFVFF